jgi:hypothetical protein
MFMALNAYFTWEARLQPFLDHTVLKNDIPSDKMYFVIPELD